VAVIFLLRFARPAVVMLFVFIGVTSAKTMAVNSRTHVDDKLSLGPFWPGLLF
jgi:hypothetical protein